MSALPDEGWLAAHRPPRRTRLFPLAHAAGYTVDDWLKLPDSGERIELIDGSFVVSPAAMGLHALCAGGLRTVLASAAKAAGSELVVVEAVNVAVGGDGLIPDIVVLPRDLVMSRMVIFPASEVAAVAEIVSPGPGNRRRDYEIKPLKYAEAGIPVFLRVELEGAGGPWVEVLELGAGGYEVTARAGAGEKVAISDPFAASFDPAHLLDT
ncbi:Uma2 family endonuclease [Nonomuraea aurantiaca]|uniref:Uma2 family endonuclease n=1 Tax=Nonomuraea aurantiaca TaxID=2878562 RepID=UPI001CD97128|nr:Uma2 family endonuclease [Nonomuraea aurantiaca]MCA2228483.1 Uma2 family endonuclease [Nonomuraea aurantiaca]